jgi:hypothetical protein
MIAYFLGKLTKVTKAGYKRTFSGLNEHFTSYFAVRKITHFIVFYFFAFQNSDITLHLKAILALLKTNLIYTQQTAKLCVYIMLPLDHLQLFCNMLNFYVDTFCNVLHY